MNGSDTAMQWMSRKRGKLGMSRKGMKASAGDAGAGGSYSRTLVLGGWGKRIRIGVETETTKVLSE